MTPVHTACPACMTPGRCLHVAAIREGGSSTYMAYTVLACMMPAVYRRCTVAVCTRSVYVSHVCYHHIHHHASHDVHMMTCTQPTSDITCILTVSYLLHTCITLTVTCSAHTLTHCMSCVISLTQHHMSDDHTHPIHHDHS